MNSPCKECKHRKVTSTFDCHDECTEYREWRIKKRVSNRMTSEERSLQKAIDYRSKYYE